MKVAIKLLRSEVKPAYHADLDSFKPSTIVLWEGGVRSVVCDGKLEVLLTVRSHFVNQLPAKVVQSGPILRRPGPSGGGGGNTFRKGSQVMMVWSAWRV